MNKRKKSSTNDAEKIEFPYVKNEIKTVPIALYKSYIQMNQ